MKKSRLLISSLFLIGGIVGATVLSTVLVSCSNSSQSSSGDNSNGGNSGNNGDNGGIDTPVSGYSIAFSETNVFPYGNSDAKASDIKNNWASFGRRFIKNQIIENKDEIFVVTNELPADYKWDENLVVGLDDANDEARTVTFSITLNNANSEKGSIGPKQFVFTNFAEPNDDSWSIKVNSGDYPLGIPTIPVSDSQFDDTYFKDLIINNKEVMFLVSNTNLNDYDLNQNMLIEVKKDDDNGKAIISITLKNASFDGNSFSDVTGTITISGFMSNYEIDIVNNNSFRIDTNLTPQDVDAQWIKQQIVNNSTTFFTVTNSLPKDWDWSEHVLIEGISKTSNTITFTLVLTDANLSGESKTKQITFTGFQLYYSISYKHADNSIINLGSPSILPSEVKESDLIKIISNNPDVIFNYGDLPDNWSWSNNIEIVSIAKRNDINGTVEFSMKLNNANSNKDSLLNVYYTFDGFNRNITGINLDNGQYELTTITTSKIEPSWLIPSVTNVDHQASWNAFKELVWRSVTSVDSNIKPLFVGLKKRPSFNSATWSSDFNKFFTKFEVSRFDQAKGIVYLNMQVSSEYANSESGSGNNVDFNNIPFSGLRKIEPTTSNFSNNAKVIDASTIWSGKYVDPNMNTSSSSYINVVTMDDIKTYVYNNVIKTAYSSGGSNEYINNIAYDATFKTQSATNPANLKQLTKDDIVIDVTDANTAKGTISIDVRMKAWNTTNSLAYTSDKLLDGTNGSSNIDESPLIKLQFTGLNTNDVETVYDTSNTWEISGLEKIPVNDYNNPSHLDTIKKAIWSNALSKDYITIPSFVNTNSLNSSELDIKFLDIVDRFNGTVQVQVKLTNNNWKIVDNKLVNSGDYTQIKIKGFKGGYQIIFKGETTFAYGDKNLAVNDSTINESWLKNKVQANLNEIFDNTNLPTDFNWSSNLSVSEINRNGTNGEISFKLTLANANDQGESIYKTITFTGFKKNYEYNFTNTTEFNLGDPNMVAGSVNNEWIKNKVLENEDKFLTLTGTLPEGFDLESNLSVTKGSDNDDEGKLTFTITIKNANQNNESKTSKSITFTGFKNVYAIKFSADVINKVPLGLGNSEINATIVESSDIKNLVIANKDKFFVIPSDFPTNNQTWWEENLSISDLVRNDGDGEISFTITLTNASNDALVKPLTGQAIIGGYKSANNEFNNWVYNEAKFTQTAESLLLSPLNFDNTTSNLKWFVNSPSIPSGKNWEVNVDNVSYDKATYGQYVNNGPTSGSGVISQKWKIPLTVSATFTNKDTNKKVKKDIDFNTYVNYSYYKAGNNFILFNSTLLKAFTSAVTYEGFLTTDNPIDGKYFDNLIKYGFFTNSTIPSVRWNVRNSWTQFIFENITLPVKMFNFLSGKNNTDSELSTNIYAINGVKQIAEKSQGATNWNSSIKPSDIDYNNYSTYLNLVLPSSISNMIPSSYGLNRSFIVDVSVQPSSNWTYSETELLIPIKFIKQHIGTDSTDITYNGIGTLVVSGFGTDRPVFSYKIN